jgi:hypothetical protein
MSNQRRNLAIQIQTPGGDNPLLVSLVSAGPYYRGVAVSGLALVGKGGTAPYAYSIIATSSNDLPPGLSVDPLSGQITGTPSLAGHFSFIAQVSDSASATFTHSFSITILAQLFWRGPPPPKGEINVSYNYQFRVFDAAGTLLTSGFTYDGTLPAGLTLSTGGLLSGTPTAPAGISYATVHATNGTDTLDIPIAIEVAELLSISSFPPGTVIVIGQPFSFGVTRTGGVDPVRYRIDPDFAAFWPDFAVINPNTGVVTGVTNDLALAGGFPGLKVLAEDALGATSSNGGFVDIVAQIIELQAGPNVSIDYTDKQNPIIGANPGAGGGIATIASVGPDSSGNLEIEGIVEDSPGHLRVENAGGGIQSISGATPDSSGDLAIEGIEQDSNGIARVVVLPQDATKGDILVFDGTNWVKHDGGADGQIIQFDSTQPDGLANITSAAVPFLTYPATILGQTPTAYWRFTEASGSIVDQTGGGADLTPGAGYVYRRSPLLRSDPFTLHGFFGLVSNCNAVRTGYSPFPAPNTGDYSISLIYKSDIVNTAQRTFFTVVGSSGSPASNYQAAFFIPGSSGLYSAFWQNGSGPTSVTTQSTVQLLNGNTGGSGIPCHLVLVVDGISKIAYFYLNGRLGSAISYSTIPSGGTSVDTRIGNNTAFSADGAQGTLGEVAVWNRKLTSTEIMSQALAGGFA